MNKDNELKICHVITSLGVGGAEYMLKRLLDSRDTDRSCVTIISLMELGKIGVQLREMGYQVYSLEMRSAFSFVTVLKRLTQILRQTAPDLVQTWMYHADLLGGLAARRAGIDKVIWSIHCTRVPAGRPMTAVVMKICAWLSRWIPQRVLCVANASKTNHIRYGYAASQMVVIPNGFEVPPLPGLRTKTVLTAPEYQGKLLIGCIGRFHVDKGQDLLLAAAAGVVRQHKDVMFVLAGNEVDRHNLQLNELVEQLGLTGHVRMLGERDDVPDLLADFDLYCMPSRTEAFPVALGEAMLAGLPCVATKVGDSQVLGGEQVLFAEPGDVAALTAALLTLLRMSAQERAELGLAGRQHVAARFAIDAVRARYHQLYREVMN